MLLYYSDKGVDIIYIHTKELSVVWPSFLNENYDINKYMILDIETTGLSPTYTHVILVGIIYYHNDSWLLTQIFCDHRSEEAELLVELEKYIHDHMLITYNGHTFDIPYLNKRYKANNLSFRLDNNKNFDLYRVIRSSKKALNLTNYKLKTIEEYLGIYREDEISGKESVELYNLYEGHPTQELRDKILLHNSDDIAYMIPTLKILNHIPEKIIERYYPFVLHSDRFGPLICTTYVLEHEYLDVVFKSEHALVPIMDFDNGYSIELSNQSCHIKVPLFSIESRLFIDIDQLTFLNEQFNNLKYEDQITYELKEKKFNLRTIIRILEKHHL